jgi:hypothetical protein
MSSFSTIYIYIIDYIDFIVKHFLEHTGRPFPAKRNLNRWVPCMGRHSSHT